MRAPIRRTIPASPFRHALTAAAAMAIAALSACSTGATRPRVDLAIVGAQVVDPAVDSPAERQTILIANDRIVALGAGIRAPRGVRVVDATGKVVIPGLWDMHAHIATDEAIGRAPENYVGHGVLGIRDMGGDLNALLRLRSDIATGRRIGPDLVIAGPTLNGLQAAPWHRLVANPDEARSAVRELKAAGVDFIKVHRAVPRDAFLAVLDESRSSGLSVAGHVPLALTWPEAAAAGLRSMEHAQTLLENEISAGSDRAADAFAARDRLDGHRGDEVFASLARADAFFDPTLVGYENTIDSKPEVAAQRRQLFEHLKSYVKRAADAGVPLLAGTDVLDHFGDALLREEERLVDAGLSPRQALAAATIAPARLMGRPDLGRLAPGSEASLLILDADPTADITHLRRLSTVVLRGRVIAADELAELRRP